MNGWSIARRAAFWFGGLLLVLLLGLTVGLYVMISGWTSGQLDAEVDELGTAAASQLTEAARGEAASVLGVLVKEGHDLGVGFILRRDDQEVVVGRAELALARPEDVEPRVWRKTALELEDGGTLLVGIDGTRRVSELDGLPGVMALIVTLFAGIAALAGWLFGRRMTVWLAEVASAVDPTGAPTPRGAPREISELVDAINAGFARAEEAQSRSKLLIVGAAHALRTPIQALLSQAQSTLRKERDPDRYRRTLAGQEHELIEFARSVDNLVAFCAESDVDHATESFDLMAELRLRLQPDHDRASRNEVELACSGPDSLLIEAERESLLLAIRNLVSNALSVSQAGDRVEVRIQPRGGRVHVTVDDEGPGIPEEDRERVFEPMRRGSNTSTEASGRARYGLGLALVRRAMEDHAGRAWIEEAPGGGARARLEFSAVHRDAAQDEGPQNEAAEARATSSTSLRQ